MKALHVRLTISVVVFSGLAILAWTCGFRPNHVTIRLVDAETDAPRAAAVRALDPDGTPLAVEGEQGRVEYLGKQWSYVDSVFAVTTAAPSITVEVRRGLETVPQTLEVDAGQGSHALPLRRWVHMRSEGYLSGDPHVHYLSIEDCHLQARAEDLNVLNLMTSDFTNDREKFIGRPDPVSTPDYIVYVGQEVRDWQLGHVNLLRTMKIVEPLEPFGGTFQGRSERNLMMAKALEAAQAQGGMTTWAHFTNLPGLESPIDIALGLVDALELMTYNDPSDLPAHRTPWDVSDMSQAEFPLMRGMDLYYQYLNAGFRQAIAAGTDKMGENIPVGSNRLYVRYEGEPTYNAWVEGMKAGRGFITNGPMLTFTVDGHEAGDVVSFSGARSVTITAAARSILPFRTLEVVANGKVVAATSARPRDIKLEDGTYSLSVTGTVDLDRSTWLAARVATRPDYRSRILPRGLTVFAHTNPVYFLRNGAAVRIPSSIAYLQKYLQIAIRWLNTRARFTGRAYKEEALRLAEEARRIYASL